MTHTPSTIARVWTLIGSVLIGMLAACDGSKGRAADGTPAMAVADAHQGGGAAGAGSKESATMETAVFGGGCFWGVEETFRRVKGVTETEVGYSGGSTANATYKDVCTDTTGHAEVVRVKFDPNLVSYEQLLGVFWKAHNPTQVNRQGPDYGTQYRSVIFYTTPEQKALAEASKKALEASGKWKRPIATQIVALGPFWRAEEYHQKYLVKNGLENCHLPEQDGD